jgi:glycosyltransferase involved in cell wall biosynthesis
MNANNVYGEEEMKDKSFPLITVITPTYKSNPKYLREAIESVLIQTYPHIEYIITDDGSENFPEKEIIEYLERNKQGNIVYKIIRNEINVGTVKNLNGALKIANGNYIFLLAQDDVYYDKQVLLERVKYFQETRALISIAFAEVVNFDLSSRFQYIPPKRKVQNLKSMEPNELLMDMWYSCNLYGCTIAFSHKYFEQFGYYDERYRLMEDGPLFYHLLMRGVKIYFWDGIAIKYRTEPNDRVRRYHHNQIYCRDKLLFLKEKTTYYTGIKKILLFSDAKRFQIKTELSNKNQKIGQIITIIEGYLRVLYFSKQ